MGVSGTAAELGFGIPTVRVPARMGHSVSRWKADTGLCHPTGELCRVLGRPAGALVHGGVTCAGLHPLAQGPATPKPCSRFLTQAPGGGLCGEGQGLRVPEGLELWSPEGCSFTFT